MGAGDPDQQSFGLTYQATAASNVVISAEPAFLHSIIVGVNVGAGAIIEVSDHASDGDGNVVLFITQPAVGVIPINAVFDVGIAVDTTLQTHLTFVWR